MKFRATVDRSGKNTTGVVVPAELVESLGSGKRPKVSATINGYTYRTSIAPMGDNFMLSVSAEVREKAGIAAGDEVEVELELDAAPREVEVPADLAEALAGDAAAKQFFEGLSYSNKRWHVLQIEGAKSAETRQKRVAKSIALLREGRAQG